jgi:hypothetical protein
VTKPTNYISIENFVAMCRKTPLSGSPLILKTALWCETISMLLEQNDIPFVVRSRPMTEQELDDKAITLVTDVNSMTVGEQYKIFDLLTSMRFRYPVIIFSPQIASETLDRIATRFTFS